MVILLSSLYHGLALSGIGLLPFHQKSRKKSFKSYLVLIQMVVSIVFLTSTIIVYKQISFMKNKNLGIELNDVIICTEPASLNADGMKRERFESIKRELLTFPSFKSATFNMYVPCQEPMRGYCELVNPSIGVSPDVMFFENNASSVFIDPYQMILLAGKDFNTEPNLNYNRVIINETSMRHLGFSSPEEALGRQVFYKSDNQQALEIIGVVANFHNEGLQKPNRVKNSFFNPTASWRLKDNPPLFISCLKNILAQLLPDLKLSFTFASVFGFHFAFADGIKRESGDSARKIPELYPQL